MVDTKDKMSVGLGHGFGDRLHAVLSSLAMAKHGRVKMVAEWCDLTPAAVSAFFKENRPPNPVALEKIVSVLAVKAPSASKEAIARFLIDGGLNPLQKAPAASLPPILQSKIYMALAKVAEPLGFNIFVDMEQGALQELCETVANIEQKQKIRLSSPAMDTIMRVLLSQLNKNDP